MAGWNFATGYRYRICDKPIVKNSPYITGENDVDITNKYMVYSYSQYKIIIRHTHVL